MRSQAPCTMLRPGNNAKGMAWCNFTQVLDCSNGKISLSAKAVMMTDKGEDVTDMVSSGGGSSSDSNGGLRGRGRNSGGGGRGRSSGGRGRGSAGGGRRP